MRHPRGFTLMEMLVVIGIIAVLMALIIPSLRLMREESRSTSCRSTLRQLGTAIQVYRQTIGDRIPICEPLPAATPEGTEGGLPDLLDGYLDKDCTCWFCSADADPDSTSAGTSYIYVPGLLRYLPPIALSVGQALIPYIENGEWNPKEIERIRRDIESREISALYRHSVGHRLALMTDSQDRHPIGDRLPRNALYNDGSVDQLAEAINGIDFDQESQP
jgi:prepilin-type N-terminal cleavage/methylation domain-containing protein